MSSSVKLCACDDLLKFTFTQSTYLDTYSLSSYARIYKPKTTFVILEDKNNPKFVSCFLQAELISDENAASSETRFVFGNRDSFLQLCKQDKKVHLLEYFSEVELKWLEASAGADVAILRKHAMNNITSETVAIKYNQPVTIIFAGYGMGKTTCLRHIEKNLITQNENAIVLFLDDKKLEKFCNNIPCTMEYFVKFCKAEFHDVDLTNSASDINLMYNNFEHLQLRFRHIIVDIMVKIHLEYRHVKQWITCSEIDCRETLESKLGTFAILLNAVSKKSQISYLKCVWNLSNNDSDKRIDSILKKCNEYYWKDICKLKLTNDDISFSSYRLHLLMIASKFKTSYSTEPIDKIDILEIYEHFIKSTYSNEHIEDLSKKSAKKLLEIISCGDRLDADVTSSTFEFVNVVNYLAAKWFSKNYQDYKNELRTLIQRNVCAWSFQYFFNSFLSRGHPLHTAVLNHLTEDVYNLSTKFRNKRDSGGRTALHLADEVFIMDLLISKHTEIDVEDKVLQWTPLQYCDCNGSLECLDALLNANADRNKLTWTLSLTQLEISKRFENALSAGLKEYTKFICDKFDDIEVAPQCITAAFSNKFPNDTIMKIMKKATKSDTFDSNRHEGTALFYAVEYNSYDAVKYLIECLEFDLHQKNYSNQTPFLVACSRGNILIANYLLDRGADINATHSNNATAFTDCCANNNLEVMTFLIERGIKTNTVLADGKSAVQLACYRVSNDVVKYLFENSATLDINYDIDYNQLLHDAVRSSSSELVELILSRKRGNINEKIDGKTALHVACGPNCVSERLAIIQILIQAGADVNATDDSGCTPVFELVHSNSKELEEELKLLIDNKCNLPHLNNNGESILHVFTKAYCSNGIEAPTYSTDVIRTLISCNGDTNIELLNSRTSSGETALHLACRNNFSNLIELLVQLGSDVHATNKEGETPLHICALTKCTQKTSSLSSCQHLIAKGADVNAKTNSGKTPIMYAVHYPPNIDHLFDLGAEIYCEDNDNKTLVHYFAEARLFDKLEFLADNGITDGTYLDSSNRSALHYAVLKDDMECIQYLVSNFETDAIITKDSITVTCGDVKRTYLLDEDE